MEQKTSFFSKKIRLGFIAAVIAVLLALYFFSSTLTDGPNRAKTRAAQAISNVMQIQLALDLYFEAHHSYPNTGGQCTLFDGSGSELVTSGFLPKQTAAEVVGRYPVKMSVSPDALHYVIESEGSGFKDASVLTTDTDGQILGCSCDDPNYCVTDLK